MLPDMQWTADKFSLDTWDEVQLQHEEVNDLTSQGSRTDLGTNIGSREDLQQSIERTRKRRRHVLQYRADSVARQQREHEQFQAAAREEAERRRDPYYALMTDFEALRGLCDDAHERYHCFPAGVCSTASCVWPALRIGRRRTLSSMP